MWGNGSCKPRNIGGGTLIVQEVNLIRPSCSAMEIQALARLLLGKGVNLEEEKKKESANKLWY